MVESGRDLRDGAPFAEGDDDREDGSSYETGQLQRCALRLYAEDALARRLGVPTRPPLHAAGGSPLS
jgi:hypothetical protein